MRIGQSLDFQVPFERGELGSYLIFLGAQLENFEIFFF
jgi:hypothetical protein